MTAWWWLGPSPSSSPPQFAVWRWGRRLSARSKESPSSNSPAISLSSASVAVFGSTTPGGWAAATASALAAAIAVVGLAEGVLLGIVYYFVGLPYPASVGAVTAVAAVIPFAAPVVALGTHDGYVYAGDLTGAVYRVKV